MIFAIVITPHATSGTPMNTPKTIIISNRLPVKAELDGDNIIYHNSEGGLATGLSCIFNSGNSLWIGWSGIPTRNLQLQHQIKSELEKRRLIPVMLCEQEINEYYEGFSNETLWPLFHYFPSYARFNAEHWESYVSVNRKFANAIIEVANEGDTIWIHDYHLMLVPAMVREILPHVSIGFFQHIPFPSYEVFRILPWRNEIVKGLMGADLIGFHTEEDVLHFTEAAEQISNTEFPEASVLSNEILIDDRSVTVNAFPMGIDYRKYDTLARSENVAKAREKILEHTKEMKLMISIDRLDYSKGIVNRLHAYDQFLQEHPEFREKVVFIQLIVPSRDNVAQYSLLKEDVNRLVGDINTRYSSFEWSPIKYFYRSLSPDELSGLYVAADVALVTPLRDGMNLVSKEYVASRLNATGVLILSEMAGASKELTQAIIINPNDQKELAAAMYQALTMPVREQMKRMKSLQRVASHNNIHNWVERFMVTLKEVSLVQHNFDLHIYNEEVEEHILHQFISRKDAAAILEQLNLKPKSDKALTAIAATS
jgi:trehalose 6-phosphate synthase/phosphatase